MLIAGAAFSVPNTVFAAGGDSPTPIIDTTGGKVEGLRGREVSRFLGIPYGADTGLHRFQPPRPREAWAGVRKCGTPGAQAPQGPISLPIETGAVDMKSPAMAIIMATARATSPDIAESEDCLFLNVWTPDASHQRQQPVMVWLHGGGFALGSGLNAMTDGALLAGHGDVVVVSLNHRLNAMGYLYLGDLHGDFADSGNVGQLDIILALKWVRDNIAAFGGNPGNVTIFGQSGGGMKVSTLLGMPAAAGLFHKAIVQSGPMVRVIEKSDAAEIGARTMAALDVNIRDIHTLQTMDRKRLIAAASAVKIKGGESQLIRTLAPMLDGRSILAHPFDPVATDLSRQVPMLIGTAKDEATLFVGSGRDFAQMSAVAAREKFTRILGSRGNAAFEIYANAHPQDDPRYWVSSLLTDTMFRTNSILQAERKSDQNAAPVFMYRVDYEPRVANRLLRSPHGAEVPLVFGNLVPREFIGAGPELAAIGSQTMRSWVSFARSGNPSHGSLHWPRYATQLRETMIIDAPMQTVADPDPATRKFWSAS